MMHISAVHNALYKTRQYIQSNKMNRDQSNSREKMRDFTVEFLKYAKFHGKFTEGV